MTDNDRDSDYADTDDLNPEERAWVNIARGWETMLRNTWR